MAKAHGIGCQICTTSWGIAAEGFSRKSSRVAATVSGIHRSNGKDFGESDREGKILARSETTVVSRPQLIPFPETGSLG
jgi:hypothetical protein